MMRGLRGVRRLFRLPETESSAAGDVAREIAFHLDMRIEELVAQGATRDEARAQAVREFGDAADAQRELSAMASKRVRSHRRAAVHEAFMQDVRSAFRSLRHDKPFSVGVIATLALAVGVNAAMFDVSDRLLFRGPPHVADPQHVMRVYFADFYPGFGESRISGYSYPTYVDLKNGIPAFDHVAAYAMDSSPVGEGTTADRANVLVASASFFDVTGVRPSLGRFFTAAEDNESAPAHVAVVSESYWRRHFGGAPGVIGQTVRIARIPYTIIGVAPRGFHGVDLDGLDVVIPLSAEAAATLGADWQTSHQTSWLSVIGHLRAGASERVAGQQAVAAYRRSHEKYGTKSYQHAQLTPLQSKRLQETIGDNESDNVEIIALLFAAVTLIVVLIACANLANLLVARTLRRTRELGVRIALGVSRRRLMSLLGAEAIVLVAAGGALGLVLARIASQAARVLLLPGVDWDYNGLGSHTASYAAALLLCCGIILTVAPALQMRRIDVHDALKAGTREGGARRARMRYALVATQAALTVLLLVCAGLFVRTLDRIQSVNLGFTPENVLVMRWDERGAGRTPDEWKALYATAVERVRHVNGVQSAALASEVPFLSATSVAVSSPGLDSLPSMIDGAPFLTSVEPAYFQTVGTKILRGRAFTERDAQGGPGVAIVDDAFAQVVWPNQSPLGKQLCRKDVGCSEVVGLVQSANRNAVTTDFAPQFFTPLSQSDRASRALFIRVRHDDTRMRALVRDAVQSAGASLPFASVRSLADIVDPMVRPARLNAILFSALAILALCVAVVGLYSVMSYAVSTRRHEMSVRLALGAAQTQVVRLLLTEAAAVLALGVVAGSLAARWAARWTTTLLFHVDPRDPVVYISVVLLIAATGMAAALIPALRSQRISPMEVLRES
jgi:predicted permease